CLFRRSSSTFTLVLLSLHDALPISEADQAGATSGGTASSVAVVVARLITIATARTVTRPPAIDKAGSGSPRMIRAATGEITGSADRKSTRLNSSHVSTSYAVFCFKK